MSDIEKEAFRQIAIDLINEYRQQRCLKPTDFFPINTPENSAFIRSIQLHEKTKQELADCKQELSDFRQTVSDAILRYLGPTYVPTGLKGFITEPKPDRLVAVFCKGLWSEAGLSISTKEIRAALKARGLEIVEVKNDDRH